MLPLKRKLTRADQDGLRDTSRPELGLVERIATCDGLGIDGGQIRVDGNSRMRVSPEPLKLRMVKITARFTSQDGPGQ
jgi:hypothetical protein